MNRIVEFRFWLNPDNEYTIEVIRENGKVSYYGRSVYYKRVVSLAHEFTYPPLPEDSPYFGYAHFYMYPLFIIKRW